MSLFRLLSLRVLEEEASQYLKIGGSRRSGMEEWDWHGLFYAVLFEGWCAHQMGESVKADDERISGRANEIQQTAVE